ncbi:MAG TPA: LpxI family protein [Rhodospirillales bacterium]|nr:LpxI family protein [Rhodospirillales bacterium]
MPPKLGILAGGGELPWRLISACKESGREFFVIAFNNQADPQLLFAAGGENMPHAWVRLGAAGKTLDLLKKAGVGDLVLVGSIKRPTLGQLMPDLWATKFLAKTGAASLGDDGILKALIKALEGEGFNLLGIDDLLPDMLTPQGVFGACQPSANDRTDIKAALAAALDIGAQDIGQGAVARNGVVIATESAAGTDAMLAALDPLVGGERSGVLVKVAKPGQEKRADLPTIGVDTVSAAAAAGLSGIAVQAGGSLVVALDQVVAAADAGGLFVIGIDPAVP